jgi:hypothetical protein
LLERYNIPSSSSSAAAAEEEPFSRESCEAGLVGGKTGLSLKKITTKLKRWMKETKRK